MKLFGSYLNINPEPHDKIPITGILLVNLGTPDKATPEALRRYLGEFLADPRITEMPAWLWWFILHGIILRFRPRRAARNYQAIWTAHGSPLLLISQQQQQSLEQYLEQNINTPIKVSLAMRYGNPSIESGLQQLRQANAQRIIILPLYPQYSSPTTGSTFDAISEQLKTWRWVPDLQFINHYHDDKNYIQALATTISEHWQKHGQAEKLLFSFHSIPKHFFLNGDPYHCSCHKTARLVAEELKLSPDQWQVVFQSRFGRSEWLQPYIDKVVKQLPAQGIKHIQVVCPGFAADCLETLEEIAHENKNYFIQAGGQSYDYIAALNTHPAHITALAKLLMQRLQAWDLATDSQLKQELQQRLTRVAAMKGD
jgi:protoporphyrin/coproporphyrin ferrochelatase